MKTKKHEGLVVFNHRGTDILVTPAVHTVLRSLTDENRKLKDSVGKLKVLELDNVIVRKQKESCMKQINELRQELRETLATLQDVNLEEALKRVPPEEMFTGFVDAQPVMQLLGRVHLVGPEVRS